MKKTIFLILVLVLLLTACGGSKHTYEMTLTSGETITVEYAVCKPGYGIIECWSNEMKRIPDASYSAVTFKKIK